jgi:transcription termination factor NusB
MKVQYAALGGVIILMAGFAVGAKWGFDEGRNHFVMIDAPARGTILVHQLEALRQGKTNFVVTSLEIELDQQILWHDDFLKRGRRYLIDEETKEAALSKAPEYMRRIAHYRRDHPSFTDGDKMAKPMPEMSEEEKRALLEIADGVRENRRTIDAIVEKYTK